MSASTRELIREFNVAFDRPVNRSWTSLSVSESELLGKLLLEECVEYCVKGLGLEVNVYAYPGQDESDVFEVRHIEGVKLDPVECVDGLADVNVVAHFNAHWHGFNLDKATEIVNESNMSKLGSDGKPIINGVTPGYRDMGPGMGHEDEGFDPSKPIGKILKGPGFIDPGYALRMLILEGDND